ncbi:hypothetical protein [Flammeovirga sp. SJP92]|uniref:hypothetical protein n=1 Tax=Flammeovirga sp. SJP92 TaxID=1775430 RepID=UPI000786E0B9|nr:hypothetical protein [Flammeovirga sp. SJP92]KXX70473.1 hypothetical protein AVL50_08935 [Flammeovirga sp. SJP92]
MNNKLPIIIYGLILLSSFRMIPDLTISLEGDKVTIGKKFIERLKSQQELNDLFTDKWFLIYHQDDRCNGSTDGKKDELTNLEIDKPISLEVMNDGEGWACPKRDPKKSIYTFDLKKLIETWNRIELSGNENGTDKIYIVGAGESDYIILHFTAEGLIKTLEYRSEDPG